MKIRNGFVSNSSSSSFMVYDRDITLEQRLLLQSACEAGVTGWTYERTYGTTICYTSMDNFDMKEYMEKIGIPLDKVIWSSNNCDDYIDGPLDVDTFGQKIMDAEKKAKNILRKMQYNSYSEDY